MVRWFQMLVVRSLSHLLAKFDVAIAYWFAVPFILHLGEPEIYR